MSKLLLTILCLAFSINLFALAKPMVSSCAVTCYKVVPILNQGTGYGNSSQALADSNFLATTTYDQCVAERNRLMNSVMQNACPLPAGTPVIMNNPTNISCGLVWKKTQVTDVQNFKCI